VPVTDRHSAYLVTLTDDIREDDSASIFTALMMVRGVLAVTPVTSEPLVEAVARQRADQLWRDRLAAVVAESWQRPT
jgi:hypothetical protein